MANRTGGFRRRRTDDVEDKGDSRLAETFELDGKVSAMRRTHTEIEKDPILDSTVRRLCRREWEILPSVYGVFAWIGEDISIAFASILGVYLLREHRSS